MEESNVLDNGGSDPTSRLDAHQPLNLVFRIDEQCEDYCSRCQQLGPAQFGVKMHRSLPSQVWWVHASETTGQSPEIQDKPYLKMCADCLLDAHLAEDNDDETITVQNADGSPFDGKGMFFIRHQPTEDMFNGT